jgi:exodeoxyribonuclease VII large subunit
MYSLARQNLERRKAELHSAELRLMLQSPVSAIAARRAQLAALVARSRTSVGHDFDVLDERLNARTLQLRALNPLAVLERGFSVSWRADDGAVVKHIRDVAGGARLRTRVTDGTFDSVVATT